MLYFWSLKEEASYWNAATGRHVWETDGAIS
jgi:hypothetical protein